MMRKRFPLAFISFLVIIYVCTVQSLTPKDKIKRSPKKVLYNETHSPSVWWFPDPHNESGVIEARMEKNPNMLREEYSCIDIWYYMYTWNDMNNPFVFQDYNDLYYYYYQYFGRYTTFVMLIHGFGGDHTANPNTGEMRQALFNYYGPDTVIIVCDWGPLAAMPWYFDAAEATDTVGWCNSLLFQYIKYYLSPNPEINLVGFSLGAHGAGNTGYWLINYWGIIPDSITGCDPAGPEISSWHTDWRLDPTDAWFVEVIHTCGGYLGMMEPCGHVDFYPDEGTPSQVGCSSWSDLAQAYSCSHSAVNQMYCNSLSRQALQRNFYMAYPCDSLQAVQDETCQWGQPYQMRFQSDVPHGIYYAYP